MANEGLDLFADAFVPGAPSLAQRPAVGRGYVRWPGDRLRRRRGGARGHYGARGAGGVWLDTRWFAAGCDPRRAVATATPRPTCRSPPTVTGCWLQPASAARNRVSGQPGLVAQPAWRAPPSAPRADRTCPRTSTGSPGRS